MTASAQASSLAKARALVSAGVILDAVSKQIKAL